MENAIVPQQQRPYAVMPTDFESAYRMAKILAASGLMPKGIQTPEAVFVAMQMGAEIGLSPMASVQNIAIINGRPGIYGDAALAVVRGSGQLEVFEEWSEGERKKPEWTFFCKVKRRGYKEVLSSYSWAQAIEAGLHNADSHSPWKKWTDRMMQFKARNFPLRDLFSDYLKGIRFSEENVDAIEVFDVSDTPKKNLSEKLKDKLIEAKSVDQLPAAGKLIQDHIADTIEVIPDHIVDANNMAIEQLMFATENESTPAQPSDPWTEFRDGFINLKSAGFSTFFYKNIERFKVCPMNIRMEAVAKWDKLYPNTLFPLNKAPEQKVTPVALDQLVNDGITEQQTRQTEALPVSYSPEYKTLQGIKEQFPAFYQRAKDELGIYPESVFNCLNLAARVNQLIEASIDTAPVNDTYDPPPVTDTSGF